MTKLLSFKLFFTLFFAAASFICLLWSAILLLWSSDRTTSSVWCLLTSPPIEGALPFSFVFPFEMTYFYINIYQMLLSNLNQSVLGNHYCIWTVFLSWKKIVCIKYVDLSILLCITRWQPTPWKSSNGQDGLENCYTCFFVLFFLLVDHFLHYSSFFIAEWSNCMCCSAFWQTAFCFIPPQR